MWIGKSVIGKSVIGKNGKGHAGFETLANIHHLYAIAQKRLENDIGVPICVPDCGKCCELNSITVKGVEGAYIAEWLRKQPSETREEILQASREWVLDDMFPAPHREGEQPKLSIYKGAGTGAMSREDVDQLVVETFWMAKSPCPMLKDARCLIHPVRPLQCRAFGVTRIVGNDVCMRSPGRGESEDTRKYISDSTVERIRNEIEKLKVEIEGKYVPHSIFVATAILLEIDPQWFFDKLYHAKIPSAKMGLFSGPLLLWQDQLQELLDRESEMRMIVNPSAP